VKHLPPADHPEFFASSRLTLNITREAMAAMGWCPSGRLFEAAACGIPLLTDHWDGLEDFFEPDREILVARSVEDALTGLELPDTQLARMAHAARARALGEHSSAARAAELVKLLEGSATRSRPKEETVACGE
jgi:spore maturation protein CgeB